MTPKEKALYLCQKFGYLGIKWEQTEYTTLSLENAKQCALIAVDEIIKSEPILPMFFNYCVGDDNPSGTTWWILVKQEIEKL